jgi:ParB/RepB/Spo0J family partition protein
VPKKPPPLTRHAVTAPTEEVGARIPGARLLPIEFIRPNPWQPRQIINEQSLDELSRDIAARGVLEPVIVRPMEPAAEDEHPHYEVIAGERRYRASLRAGLERIPAIVRDDMNEEQAREASLVENLLREDLDIEDEARFLKALYDQKRSLRAVGEAIHKSYQYVNRRLKLANNPQALLAYREGLINLDHLIGGHADEDGDSDEWNASTLVDEGGESGKDRGREHPANLDELEEVRFYRTRSTLKPFHKLQLHVRRLQASSVYTITTEDRPKLRQAVHELIEELAQLEDALNESGVE